MATWSELKIKLIETGDETGTWGETTNENFNNVIEQAITGSAAVSFSDADVTLPLADTTDLQNARALRLSLTGTVTAPRTLYVPNIQKFYLIDNGLTEAITVQNTVGAGAALTIPAGRSTLVFNDATDIINPNTYFAGAILSDAAVILGGAINATPIGGISASTGAFTTLEATSVTTPTVKSDTSLTFQTDGTTTAVTIDDAQNVGIGTVSPTAILQVNSTASIVRPIVTATTGYTDWVVANTGGNIYFGIDNSAGGISGTAYGRHIYSDGAYPLDFFTNATQQMRITSAGNVGIGTTSPTNKLDISGGNARLSYSATDMYYGLENTASGGRSWAVTATATGSGEGAGLFLIKDTTSGTGRFYINSSGAIGVTGSSFGTSGQVLTSGGASVAPSWDTPVFPAIQGARKNLKLSTTGLSAAVTVTADALTVLSASGNYRTLTNISLASLNTGNTSGSANSLDTGAWAFSTWYYVFVIYDGATTAGLFSLSATAPTLPSGYTHFARVGAIRTQSATNYNPLGITQYNDNVQYKVVAASNVTSYPIVATGPLGTVSTTAPVWVAASVTNFVPSTAGIIKIVNAVSTSAYVSPNNATAGVASSANNPSLSTNYQGSGLQYAITTEMVLESTNIYVAISTGDKIRTYGWIDNL